MSVWQKIFGNTKKEESQKVQSQDDDSKKNTVDYKKKYERLKEIHLKFRAESESLVKNMEEVLTEWSIANFILFATTVQCGGELEISKSTIDIAKKMQKEHELELNETDCIKYTIKRKEAK